MRGQPPGSAPGARACSNMIVRLMGDKDIPIATALLAQLGYETAETARRLAIVQRADNHRVWIAEHEGAAVGLLHAFFRPALEKPPEVIVQALVVEVASRAQGVGEMLMSVAEQWAREIGSPSMSLYSGLQRAAAHRFYERLGYTKAGTAYLLRKLL